MSRGHKIIANFLRKRGAWDNNPYKETEMKKETPPFEPDKKPKKIAVAGKAGYGPSAARHLAQLGLKQQMLKVNPKLAESWDAETLNELSKKTLGAYVKKATGGLEGAAQQGYEAGRRGAEGGANYGKAIKRIKGVEKAVDRLTREAVSYAGIGTDVVDKKKKLNPQPALTMKPKQVKDFKEENLDELKASTLQSYADKAHQQALDATYDAAHLNRTGEEKLKADAKRLAAKRAGGVQMAQTKLDRIKEALELPHSIGDLVTCNSTHRLASVQSVEGDQYTVVYADGSTQTGPADYWTNTRPVNEARVVEQPRGWNVRGLKPAGHGIIGKKVRSYDFPGLHDSHYIEGHVVGEDPHSYHIRTTKVVRYNKEEPIPEHLATVRAPKGLSVFGGAPGVYHATAETAAKPVAPRRNRTLRGMRK